MNRRRFLSLSAAATGALVVGPYFRGRSYAATFGEFPTGAPQLPEARRAKRVLEVFLYGGISPWETFYLVKEFGVRTNEQYWAFPDTVTRLRSSGSCGKPSDELGHFFAKDSAGRDVFLGPAAWALWEGPDARPDMIARMRVIVQKHTLEPHEAAVPLALTGRPVGQPSAAGLGAHVQRYFVDRSGPERKAPFSYVFATGGISNDNVIAAAQIGVHPGSARPLHIKVDNTDELLSLLGRPTVGANRAGHDRLLDTYIEKYQRRLRWPDTEAPVRSARLSGLVHGHETVKNVDAIRSVMPAGLFDRFTSTVCGDTADDIPGVSLRAARHLLTHPEHPATYVCVSDSGLIENNGAGYDTHNDQIQTTARNLTSTLRHLSAMINRPGENDPTKLNLDDTLIILNTEFGRTPGPQFPGSDGRNHYPYGYVTSMIGGPITTAQKGVYGNIDAEGIADTHAIPAENRMAALLALGVWPFAQEAFAVSDSKNADSEEHAAELAMAHYLGIDR